MSAVQSTLADQIAYEERFELPAQITVMPVSTENLEAEARKALARMAVES